MKFSLVLLAATSLPPIRAFAAAEDTTGEDAESTLRPYLNAPIFRHRNTLEHHVELTFGRGSNTQELALDLGSEAVSIDCDSLKRVDDSLQQVSCSSDSDCHLQSSTCRKGKAECLVDTMGGHPLSLGYRAFEYIFDKAQIGSHRDRKDMTDEFNMAVVCQEKLGPGFDSYACDGLLGLSASGTSFNNQL